MYRCPETLDFNWLGNYDSNLDEMIQSHLCYRYTIPQHTSMLYEETWNVYPTSLITVGMQKGEDSAVCHVCHIIHYLFKLVKPIGFLHTAFFQREWQQCQTFSRKSSLPQVRMIPFEPEARPGRESLVQTTEDRSRHCTYCAK